MNKQQLNVIQRVLDQRPEEVLLNQTWRYLHDSEGIGTPDGRSLKLNRKDFEYLSAIIERHTKQEGWQNECTNRLQSACYFKNEKIHHQGVFDELLVFANPNVPLPLAAGDIPAGITGFLPTLMPQALCLDGIQNLLIVENASMLIHWQAWFALLPPNWQSSLLLYRGHGSNVALVQTLLSKLPAQTNVAIYTDFDLAGLKIIASEFMPIRPIHIAIPKCWQELTCQHLDNQIEKFMVQYYTVGPYLDKLENPVLSTLYAHLKSQKLAVMQENAPRLGQLEVVPINCG